GEGIGAYALTEPDAGSDALASKTNAKEKDGGYVLNGEKQWITNADVAAVYLVFAKTTVAITAFIFYCDFDVILIGQEESNLGIGWGICFKWRETMDYKCSCSCCLSCFCKDN